jgi:ribonuclease D
MTVYFHEDDIPNEIQLEGSLAIDTETMGLKTNRDRLCLIQISSGNGDAHLLKIENNKLNSKQKYKNLKKILQNKNILKIFHFARFDLAALNYYICKVEGNIWCTKIASKLSRTYTNKHGLSDLTRELLSIEISKEQQSSNWGSKIISKKQKNYAANDVLYLHKLKEKLEAILLQENRIELAEKVFSFLKVRVELDLAGFEDLDIFAH